MMAIIRMFFQDGLTGSACGDSALYTNSPECLSDQGGFAAARRWGPLGFAKNGSKDNVLRRRAVTIKHGRFSL